MNNAFYSQENHGPFEYFELGDFELLNGAVIPDCRIAYRTFGTLNSAGDNAIMFPHMFSGTSKHMEMYIGSGMALDPDKYFIVLPNMLGNGLSTSPHNAQASIAMDKFPEVTIGDDVLAQHRLATHLGVSEIQLVLGWSMGAQQTFEWAVRFPAMIKRAAPIGGTAKGTPHNQLMVDNLMQSITSDPAWANGGYADSADVSAGLSRLARFFAMIGVCKEFYASEQWKKAEFKSVDEFLSGFWEAWFAPMDPNALLTMLKKWRAADVSLHTGGDLSKALGRIEAKVFNMPFVDDMMFTVDECEREHLLTPHSELRPIPSLWGHFAFFGVFPQDKDFIDTTLKELLSTDA